MTATYTAITTGEIDVDSPVTQPLLTKLRDNALAVGYGTDKVALTYGTRAASTAFQNTSDAAQFINVFFLETVSTCIYVIEISPDASTWSKLVDVRTEPDASSNAGFPLPIDWYWRWRLTFGSATPSVSSGGLTDG